MHLCPKLRASVHSSDQAGLGPTLPSLAWATHPYPGQILQGTGCCAVSGRVFSLPLTPTHTPVRTSKPGDQILYAYAPVAAMVRRRGKMQWEKRGSSPGMAQRNTSYPHQQEVLVSMTLSRPTPV